MVTSELIGLVCESLEVALKNYVPCLSDTKSRQRCFILIGNEAGDEVALRKLATLFFHCKS